MSIKLHKITILLLTVFCCSCESTKTITEKPETITEKILQVKEENSEDIDLPDSSISDTIPQKGKSINPPPINIHEFRAAWVASVANINWPSKPGLSTSEQQREALVLLDSLEALHFNAVILQVRPQGDALYESNLEPWSYFLTGEEGKAPNPYYDPLKFWVNAAHERDIELHAWLNPYRAYHTTGGPITGKSFVKRHPEFVVELENGMWWMDPSKKETQDHTSAVVKDLVERYDIDAIHFDDYFYPYDSYNGGKDFPDDASWKSYQNKNGTLSRGDWRRDHVNRFVYRIYREIKNLKTHVKFGISPFGIWRPGFPESVTGYDQYKKLYADARLWLNEGWVDYFSPQLYWKINQFGQSFPELLNWWSTENLKHRHLWPGIRLDYGGGSENIDETINQIMITRGMLPTSKGTLHWSIAPIMNYPDLSRALKEGPYKKKVVVPATPWLTDTILETPEVITYSSNNELRITWSHPQSELVKQWVLYFKYKQGNWDYKLLKSNITETRLQSKVGESLVPLEEIGISAIDRLGNESQFKGIYINN
ncbi:MAG: family 10 glycosylhydrolase [Leeuwenhoekiella sp.]